MPDRPRSTEFATTQPPADTPDSPTEMTPESWRYVARKTWRQLGKNQYTDLAAPTYYAVLALFPAVIALLSSLAADTSARASRP